MRGLLTSRFLRRPGPLLLLGLLMSITWPRSFAQQGTKFRHLTHADGLPADRIQAITEDDLGNLWIGTSAGLVKYDGADFYPIEIRDGLSLDQTNIACLFHDSQKNMWIGTVEFGLYAINTRTGKTQVYFHNTDDPESLPDNRITTIFEDQNGQVWFGAHRKGICRLRPGTRKFENFRPSEQFPELEPREADVILSSLADPFDRNRVWLGTLQGLFSMDLRSGKMERYVCNEDNLTSEGPFSGWENLTRSIYQQDSNTLWLGTWGGGLVEMDIAHKTFVAHHFESPIPVSQIRNVVRNILPKSEREVWAILLGGKRSLGVFDLARKQFFRPFEGKFPEPRTNWTCFYEDRKGNVWAGSSQGLFVGLRQKYPFQFKALPYSVREVFPHPDGKRLFCATDRGARLLVQDLEKDTFQVHPFRPLLDKGMGINCVHEVHFFKDEVLVLENTDLYRYEPGKDSLQLRYKLEVEIVRKKLWGFLDSELDGKGNLWMGNKYAGLFRLNLESGELQHYAHDPANPASMVHTAWVFEVMRDSQENIWYGTEEGWGYFRASDEKFVNFPYNSNRSGIADVQLKEVHAMAEDPQGRIWLGSHRRGLAFLRAETGPDEVIRTFTTADGLRSDAIWEMCMGQNGNLWLVTQAGLSMVNTADFSIRNFGAEYGLENLGRVSQGPDGTLYLGAKGGYFYFRPEDLEVETARPKVLLRSLRVMGEDFQGAQALNYLDQVSLDHDENFLALEYAALNFFNPELVEYAYQMEGVDEDWVLAGKRKFCNYTELNPGTYVFRVRARIEDQPWGAASELRIHIRRPFWQTWWFISLVLALISFIVYRVVKWRIALIRQQTEAEREFNDKLRDVEKKALQAQMNPHFLFNCLNSIKLLILKSEKEKAAAYLTTFSKLIRLVLQNSEQSMINLADELQALELYMTLERLRLNEKFDYEIQVGEGIRPDHLQYPPLVLQPMVENAIWHGLSQKNGQGKLTVTLARQAGGLEITIADNGIGREAAHGRRRNSSKGKSFGLAITRERLRLAFPPDPDRGAEPLRIEDLYQEDGTPAGTQVRIFTPLLRLRHP